MPRPDVVFYLDMTAEQASARNAGTERYERREFQEKVKECFETLWNENWVSIDATRDPDAVLEQLCTAAKPVLESLTDRPVSCSLWNVY